MAVSDTAAPYRFGADVAERRVEADGGALCLAFCNTVGWHAHAYMRAAGRGAWVLHSDGQPAPHELFSAYESMVRWFARQGSISEGDAEHLIDAANRQTAEAETVRQRAIGLRESLYRLLTAQAGGVPPDARDIAAVNAWLPEAFSHRRLTHTGFPGTSAPHSGDNGVRGARGQPGHYEYVLVGPTGALEWPLWPVVWSAVDLLMQAPETLSRVRVCANDPCGWLFVDQSRNRSRRWCDMSDCGNKVKARRHYARVRAERSGGGNAA